MAYNPQPGDSDFVGPVAGGSGGLSLGSLANPAAAAGMNLGLNFLQNAVPGMQSPQQKLTREQQIFQQQLAIYRLRQQNLTRGAVLPGMYQTLGYSPEKAQSMTEAYTTGNQLPGQTTGAPKAHNVANQWVQGNQNPFDADMANIDKQVQAGQLTPEEAVAQRSSKAQDYITKLNAFGTQGANENKVARQALDTFHKYYGDPAQFGAQSAV